MAEKMDRRDALKKVGAAGTIAWVAPMVHGSFFSPAMALSCPPSAQQIAQVSGSRWNSNCGQGGRWNGQVRNFSITLPGCGTFNLTMDVGAPGTPGQGQAPIANPNFTIYNGSTVVATANGPDFNFPGCATWACNVIALPECVNGNTTAAGGCDAGDCNGSKLDAQVVCCPV